MEWDKLTKSSTMLKLVCIKPAYFHSTTQKRTARKTKTLNKKLSLFLLLFLNLFKSLTT